MLVPPSLLTKFSSLAFFFPFQSGAEEERNAVLARLDRQRGHNSGSARELLQQPASHLGRDVRRHQCKAPYLWNIFLYDCHIHTYLGSIAFLYSVQFSYFWYHQLQRQHWHHYHCSHLHHHRLYHGYCYK